MSEITREQEVLLHLLQKSFRPDTEDLAKEILQSADWRGVFKEAAQQAVLITAFDAAAAYKACIPGEVYMQVFQRVSRGMMNNLRVSAAQKELTTLLESKGYPCVILKGEVSAAYYPKPELRHLGDVDFLIDPAQREEIEQVLLDAGYDRSGQDHNWHIAFKKDKAHLEMHFEIPGIPVGKVGELIRQYRKDLLASAKRIREGCWAPEDDQHGLILLLHMGQHMISEGLGLRHLCDWAAFVDRTWQERFWQEDLLPLLKEIGLFRYAAVMTKLCSMYLGIVFPPWAQAEDELCNAVLNDILIGGNFGRKDPERSKAGMMLAEQETAGVSHSSTEALFRKLHRATEKQYPIVKKVKILHPVLDAYRAGLYLCRRAAGKRPSLLKMAPLAQERRSVYEQLEIFETQE